jgi:hypothetical protein
MLATQNAGFTAAEVSAMSSNAAPALVETAAAQIPSEMAVNGWSLGESGVTGAANAAASGVAPATTGSGLLQGQVGAGLNAAPASSTINLANSANSVNSFGQPIATGGLSTPPPSNGLLDSFQTWAKDNPTLAMGAVQTVGSGLSGMASASSAADQIAYKQAQDDLRRRNSAYAKVPTTTWK